LGFKSSFLKSSLGPIHKIIEKNRKYPQRCGRCASPTSMREEALLVLRVGFWTVILKLGQARR
jgi:hypothetical protein